LRPRVILLDPFTPNGAQQLKTHLGADPLLGRTPLIVGPGGFARIRACSRGFLTSTNCVRRST